jgi:hypothetical protein
MDENKEQQVSAFDQPRQLTFNTDGTIDPAQLEGLDPEAIARFTSPEFVAQAKREIAKQESFRRASAQIKAAVNRRHELRRPSGVSGRQRKLLRKAASRLARAAQKVGA